MSIVTRIIILFLISLLAFGLAASLWMLDNTTGLILGVVLGGLVTIAGGLFVIAAKPQQKGHHQKSRLARPLLRDILMLQARFARPARPLRGAASPRSIDIDRESNAVDWFKEINTLLSKIVHDRTADDWDITLSRATAAGRHLTREQREARQRLLGSIDERSVLAAIDGALRESNSILFGHSIVSLPLRRLAFLECCCHIRLKSDTLKEEVFLTPEQYGPIAEDADLLAGLQSLLLIQALSVVRSTSRTLNQLVFLCPMGRASLESDYFNEDFLRLLELSSPEARRLIFLIKHHDVESLTEESSHILTRLNQAGYRLCLDKIASLGLPWGSLRDLGIRLIKIPAPLIGVQRQRVGADYDPMALLTTLDRHGMDGILTHIDDESVVRNMEDHRFAYGQGRLFSSPVPVDSHYLEKLAVN